MVFFDTRYLKTPLRLISYNQNKCLGTLPVCVLRAIILCQVRDVRGRGRKVNIQTIIKKKIFVTFNKFYN